MKLTRLTCVWLYDTTGGKVVSSRWQLYQVQMRENHFALDERERPSTRGEREREAGGREGGREGGERDRKGREMLGMKRTRSTCLVI